MQMLKEVDVNVSTLRNVEAVLRKASVPVSRYHILKGLAARGTGTTHPRLEVALTYLVDHELVFDGERGLQWVGSDSDSLQRAIATGRRV